MIPERAACCQVRKQIWVRSNFTALSLGGVGPSLLSEPMVLDLHDGANNMRLQKAKDCHQAWCRVGTQDMGASFPTS